MEYNTKNIMEEHAEKSILALLNTENNEESLKATLKKFLINERESKTNTIWRIEKKIKEKDEAWTSSDGLQRALIIAKIFTKDEDPGGSEGERLNKEIEAGEEIRNIYTVRGTVPWLLQTLIATFKSEVYTDAIALVEKLADDPIFYVRQQATVPLSLLAANIRAKKVKDGDKDDFYFGSKTEDSANRNKVRDLCFWMLRENITRPRVLEHVLNIFGGMRMLNRKEAQEVVDTFFYSSHDRAGTTTQRKLQPDYLIQHAAPLAIFFAEYRQDVHIEDIQFTQKDGLIFKEKLHALINDAQKQSSVLLSSLLWHTWKEISNDPKNYARLEKYFPDLLAIRQFFLETLPQREFLIREIAKINQKLAIEELNIIADKLGSPQKEEELIRNGSRLLVIPEILEIIHEKNPTLINKNLKILAVLDNWNAEEIRKKHPEWFF